MKRLCHAVLITVAALAVNASPASAAADGKLGATLGALWQNVLETPLPDSVFGPDGDTCVDLGGVVAPFTVVIGDPELTCTVKPGTKIFVAAWTSECSTLEPPPYFGADETELLACARAVDAGVSDIVVTLDGKPVTVSEVESPLLHLDMPADNIFGADPGPALSLAHGWVALLRPMTPGVHEITLHVEATYLGGAVDFDNTTTIIVSPGA